MTAAPNRPLFGMNAAEYGDFVTAVGASPAAWRGYGSTGNSIPAPRSGTNYHIASGSKPAAASVAVISLRPDVPTFLGGSLDSALSAYAAAMNSGDILTLWHEGEAGNGWTPSQIIQMHQRAYPLVKAANPHVLYGQLFTCFTANPSSGNYPLGQWVAAQSGGAPLDVYGLDGYSPQSTGYTIQSVFGASCLAIRNVVGAAQFGIFETNANPESSRVSWLRAAYRYAVGNRFLTFFPFYSSSSSYPWDASDSATIALLGQILADTKTNLPRHTSRRRRERALVVSP